jgi:uncharacterized protein involved in exopolysaccharide biosynthesis
MSQEKLGLGRLLLIVRRPWATVIAVAVVGLLAGAGYAALSPQLLTSKAAVLLSSHAYGSAAEQAVSAHSDAVLTNALRSVAPAVSLQTMRSRVQVTRLTDSVLSISAQGETAAQAQDTANAVTRSYIAFISRQAEAQQALRSRVQVTRLNAVARSYIAYISRQGEAQRPARVLDAAAVVPGTSQSHRLLVAGALGALLGALIAAICAMAFSIGGRHLAVG